MQGVGFVEDDSALIEDPASRAGVDDGRRDQAQVPVAVVVAVPVDELAVAVEGVVVALKAIGEVGVALDRLELARGLGVVVARARPAVRSGNSEGCEPAEDRAVIDPAARNAP